MRKQTSPGHQWQRWHKWHLLTHNSGLKSPKQAACRSWCAGSTLAIGERIDSALALVGNSVDLTVNNWTAVASLSNSTLAKQVPLFHLLTRIDAVIAAKDAAQLEALLLLLRAERERAFGPLMVALYAACQKHFGL